MPATGAHLKIVKLGDNCHGVELHGDRTRPEHAEFRVSFPGGDVNVVRTTDGNYWIHVRVNRPTDGPQRVMGKMIDARLDIIGRHSDDVDRGDFADPNLHHLAVRIARDEQPAAAAAAALAIHTATTR